MITFNFIANKTVSEQEQKDVEREFIEMIGGAKEDFDKLNIVVKVDLGAEDVNGKCVFSHDPSEIHPLMKSIDRYRRANL